MDLEERNQTPAELVIYSLTSSDPFAFIKEQIDFYHSLIADDKGNIINFSLLQV